MIHPKKPKPELKTRRISQTKKNSFMSEPMGSDGSNSSRKENVPPELMICIEMNNGNDSGSGAETIRKGSAGRNGNSPYRSKYTPGSQGNSGSPTRDPSQWRSYSNDPDPMDPSVPAIPKFDIDPDIPLETMAPMKTTSESEQSDSGGNRAHQTGLIIGDEMLNVDPNTQYEMQRKKERIMQQSLRRKEQAKQNKMQRQDEKGKKRLESKKKNSSRKKKKG